jgi:hypothetical protein
MKTILLISVLLVSNINAEQPSGLITNPVDIFPYIQTFARKLDLDIPLPLTTNRISRLYPYRGFNVNLWFDNKRWAFSFNPKTHAVNSFVDTNYCLRYLAQRPMSPEALKKMSVPPTMTQEQALKTARSYLAALGYVETNAPVLPPRIELQPPFPIYIIAWPWTAMTNSDAAYYKMEIDGYHVRVTSFFALGGSGSGE